MRLCSLIKLNGGHFKWFLRFDPQDVRAARNLVMQKWSLLMKKRKLVKADIWRRSEMLNPLRKRVCGWLGWCGFSQIWLNKSGKCVNHYEYIIIAFVSVYVLVWVNRTYGVANKDQYTAQHLVTNKLIDFHAKIMRKYHFDERSEPPE